MIDCTGDQMNALNQYFREMQDLQKTAVPATAFFVGCVKAMLTILPGPPSALGAAER
jgi:hypothetical protein